MRERGTKFKISSTNSPCGSMIAIPFPRRMSAIAMFLRSVDLPVPVCPMTYMCILRSFGLMPKTASCERKFDLPMGIFIKSNTKETPAWRLFIITLIIVHTYAHIHSAPYDLVRNHMNQIECAPRTCLTEAPPFSGGLVIMNYIMNNIYCIGLSSVV